MKINVDVLRCEQSWDFETGTQHNFFVISVFGAEVAVPCTQEHLIAAVQHLHGHNGAARVEQPEADAGFEQDEPLEPSHAPEPVMQRAPQPAQVVQGRTFSYSPPETEQPAAPAWDRAPVPTFVAEPADEDDSGFEQG